MKRIASPNVKVEVLDTCLGSPRVGYLHAYSRVLVVILLTALLHIPGQTPSRALNCEKKTSFYFVAFPFNFNQKRWTARG